VTDDIGQLPPLTQLVAFADYYDQHFPPAKNQTHVCRWAADTIEKLMEENARLRMELMEARADLVESWRR